MKIMVTGSNGFLGRNLIVQLENMGYKNIFKCDMETSEVDFNRFCQEAEFVYHLAGINRPKNDSEFMEGNYDFTKKLLNNLFEYSNKSPIVLSSSIQAALDNHYGVSKRASEQLLFEYGANNRIPVYIYRFVNLYGKWSKPNYNSVVATFCYNISRKKDVRVDNPDTVMNLCYIDDVINELIKCINGQGTLDSEFYTVPEVDQISIGELKTLIESFRKTREDLSVPNLNNRLQKNLYSTYLSFLSVDNFSYPLTMNNDDRGSFTEFLKTPDRGQVSINISKPGITKGNHWHNTKNEKFLVVSGEAVVRFREINTREIIEYFVSSESLEVIDIPVGYTHNITNIGNTDLVTVMWVNEVFNHKSPDTYFLEV